MSEKKVKIAYCKCGKSVQLVSTLPHAESCKDTVKEFSAFANAGHKIDYVTLAKFKTMDFLTCDCK
jgi:hypothetical protein